MTREFWEYATDTIKSNIDCLTGCERFYGCDLVHLATENENMTGAWIIGRVNAFEFIAENYDDARDTAEYIADFDIGDDSANAVLDPEGFTFWMLYYAADQLIHNNPVCMELIESGDYVEATQELVDAINAAF